MLELLAAHLAGWACSAGFPELAHVPLLRLRRFAASTPVERFRSAARGLAAALEANAGFVAAARARAGVAPADARALQTFLAAEDAAQAVRLCRGFTYVCSLGSSVCCASVCPRSPYSSAGFLQAPLQRYAALLAEKARQRQDLLAAEHVDPLDERAGPCVERPRKGSLLRRRHKDSNNGAATAWRAEHCTHPEARSLAASRHISMPYLRHWHGQRAYQSGLTQQGRPAGGASPRSCARGGQGWPALRVV